MVTFCGKIYCHKKKGWGVWKKKKRITFVFPDTSPDLFFCFSFHGKVTLCGYTFILVPLLVSILFL